MRGRRRSETVCASVATDSVPVQMKSLRHSNKQHKIGTVMDGKKDWSVQGVRLMAGSTMRISVYERVDEQS